MTDELPHDDRPLEPIAGVPQWCNDFLAELAEPKHRGVIRYAAIAVGRTWDAVSYWRDKNPDFAARLAQIYETVNQDVDDQIENRLLAAAIDGYTETITETGDEGTTVKVKETYDPKVAQWLLTKRRRQRYGEDESVSALNGPTIIVFKLGDDSKTEEIEGETIEDAELEPRQGELTEAPPEKPGLN